MVKILGLKPIALENQEVNFYGIEYKQSIEEFASFIFIEFGKSFDNENVIDVFVDSDKGWLKYPYVLVSPSVNYTNDVFGFYIVFIFDFECPFINISVVRRKVKPNIDEMGELLNFPANHKFQNGVANIYNYFKYESNPEFGVFCSKNYAKENISEPDFYEYMDSVKDIFNRRFEINKNG